MKNIKTILLVSLSLLCTLNLWGQEAMYKLTGKIISENNTPIEGAIVTVQYVNNVATGADGTFTAQLDVKPTVVAVWAPGYYSIEQLVNDRSEVIITLIPENKYKYNESRVLPHRGTGVSLNEYTAATNITKKDFLPGSNKIDRALAGQVAGLQLKRMSGMPGEGSYYNLRGIRSLTGDNAPLIVIDGVPVMPDKTDSPLLSGFTRDIFQSYNIQDIQNITILKGAEASIYGSLGSNGVILIETDGAASDDLETTVSYYGTFGVNWNSKRYPLLSGRNYNAYLSEVGLTNFNNIGTLQSNFPFLNDPDNVNTGYLYNHENNWQDLIYQNSFTTDNLFRVEGGDEIAKYDLSLGYAKDNGVYNNSSMDRYHARLNSSVLVSSKVNIFFIAGLAYLNTILQEQGMSNATNPILAAYAKSPRVSPYNKDRNGNTLSTYSDYYFGQNTTLDFGVSNPLAIVNTLDARARQYDLNMKVGVNYTPIRDLTLTGTFGMYYNYDNEHLFIPGLSDNTILPITDLYGTANNTVKDGVAETFNMFYQVNARYTKIFDEVHKLNAIVGGQIMTTKNEYDAGEGRNTANDFYQTLGNTQAEGRRFFGYLNNWNWMNYYVHADYTYNDMWQAAVNFSLDGASSSGSDAAKLYAYPSVSLAWLGKGWEPLQNSTIINKLIVRAEYGVSGNSRYSTNLGKYYYQSVPFDEISTIARAGIGNTKLKPEKNNSLNVGLDMSILQNRLSFTVDYYNNQISDMIAAQPLSSVYGSYPYYANIGKMENKGIEFAFQAIPVRVGGFEWIIGGNIAKASSKIKSLGGVDQITYNSVGDAQLVTRVGDTPYQFYGYEAVGVFSTQAEADAANLSTPLGGKYQAGDVKFVDQNGDGIIDDKDRVAIGSTAPKYFGGFYTQFSYHNFALSADFSYSKGNMAYNAVRRELESMSTLGNQSEAVLNRWVVDGQVTDVPRAQYGDPSNNSAFSTRWIEDASYLKLRNITFSYRFNKTVLGFFRSGMLYVTGENLVTFSKYLGLDPEVAYSYSEAVQGMDYAKMVQPRSVKFGINLKF